MGKVFVLSHASDIDGIGSAALLTMRYHISLDNIFFTHYGKENIKAVAARLKRRCREDTTLFITDLGVNKPTAYIFLDLIRTVKSRHGRVVWFDHHAWMESEAMKVARSCDLAVFGSNSENVCACEIVKNYTKLGGPFVDRFARLVHYRDFYQKPKDMWLWHAAEKYTWALEYYGMRRSYDSQQRGLRHMVGTISSGRFFDGQIIRAAEEFRRINEKGINEMMQGIQMLSGIIAVGFAKRINSTDACARILEGTKADIAILVHTDTNSGSVKSRVRNIEGLSRALWGGGREHTAGFHIEKSYNLERKKYRELFVKKVESEAKRLRLIP